MILQGTGGTSRGKICHGRLKALIRGAWSVMDWRKGALISSMIPPRWQNQMLKYIVYLEASWIPYYPLDSKIIREGPFQWLLQGGKIRYWKYTIRYIVYLEASRLSYYPLDSEIIREGPFPYGAWGHLVARRKQIFTLVVLSLWASYPRRQAHSLPTFWRLLGSPRLPPLYFMGSGQAPEPLCRGLAAPMICIHHWVDGHSRRPMKQVSLWSVGHTPKKVSLRLQPEIICAA